MSRKPTIFGNWKLHNTVKESEVLAKGILEGVTPYKEKVNIGFAPVFTSLINVKSILGKDSGITFLAQNGYPKPIGAYTGEVSFPLLADVGCDGVLVGHSERRHLFNESDELIGEKVGSALQTGLTVVLCMGETLDEREAGKTWEVVERQLSSAMFHVPPSLRHKLILAYEPVWAIGTGKTASPEQAQEVHALIRKKITESWLNIIGDNIIILYGGSVKPSNAASLFAKEDIDGALVGGASLKVDSFIDLVKAGIDSIS